MLQSLLQPRESQRSNMIGAMPAVAVRHERRRGEKRGGGRRPSQLPLQVGRPGDPDATPSPDRHHCMDELYVCGKVAVLYAVVGSLLLGIVLMVVGLVQLSPGAEAAHNRYYLMGCGAILLGVGFFAALFRGICLHWYDRKMQEEYDEETAPAANTKNGVSVVEGGHSHGTDKSGHSHDQKPRLKSQPSVGKDVDTLIKQPSATSDT